jgi:5-methylcytosine-specific restriction enzyme subunit McrC
MYAYSKKYRTSEIWLLYPMTRDFREHKDICFRCSEDELQKTKVNLFFIDLADEGSFSNLVNRVVETSEQ